MSDSKKIDQIQEKVDSVSSTVYKIDKEIALQKAAFEAHTKQDEHMYEELKRMNDILQNNTESLKEHMQNNVLLKEMIANMNSRLNPIELEHIQKTAVKEWLSHKLKWTVKIATAIAAVAGAWIYLKPLFWHFLIK